MFGAKITSHPLYDDSHFVSAKGIEFQHALYTPNSFQGWINNSQTQMRFDPSTGAYISKPIHLSKVEVDNGGRRFKITTEDWKHQFGFGEYTIAQHESVFGVHEEAVVVKTEMAVTSTADLRYELPEAVEANIENYQLTIELKIFELTPRAKALMRVSLSQLKR